MSAYVVVPERIISSAASRVPTRTNSGDTVLASAGKMYFCSQSISARSSARPRYRTMGACVCVLIRPGRTMLAGEVDAFASAVLRGDGLGGVHGDDVRPSMATLPGDRTRPLPSIVTTMALSSTNEMSAAAVEDA